MVDRINNNVIIKYNNNNNNNNQTNIIYHCTALRFLIIYILTYAL